MFAHEFERAIPPTRLLCRRRVDATPEGVLHRFGRVLSETHAYPSQAAEWRKPRTRMRLFADGLLRARRNVLSRAHGWITDSQSFEFFHWMTDTLPRLLVLRDRMPGLPVALPAGYRRFPYIPATLESFPGLELAWVERHTRFRSLLIPTHTAPTGNYHEETIRRLRDHLRSAFGPPNAQDRDSTRLYISRARAARRRVVNDEQLSRAVEASGFRVAHFENLPFERQARLAHGVTHLVSNHGAGLTNMLFMAPGTRVLELRREGDDHLNCYYALASALGIDYLYQTAPVVDPAQETHLADLVVDIPGLQRNLALLLTG